MSPEINTAWITGRQSFQVLKKHAKDMNVDYVSVLSGRKGVVRKVIKLITKESKR